MQLSRLRAGEALALIGSIALFCLLFATWAQPESSLLPNNFQDVSQAAAGARGSVVGGFVDRYAETGWGALGWFLVLMLCLTMLAAVSLAVLTITERETPVLGVVAEVWTFALALISSIVVLIRLTLAQPGLDLGFADSQVDVRPIAWLGLLALVVTGLGAWIAMADERTESRHSPAPDVPVRPAPPAATHG